MPFGECRRNDGLDDGADHSGYGHDRTHIRLWDGNDPSVPNRQTFTTPHLEDWYWATPTSKCGSSTYAGLAFGSHAVKSGAVDRGDDLRERQGSGFDRARAFVARRFRKANYATRSEYKGNTRSVKQCNGQYAGSNGNVYYIRVGKLGH
jgi:hypothetical protein